MPTYLHTSYPQTRTPTPTYTETPVSMTPVSGYPCSQQQLILLRRLAKYACDVKVTNNNFIDGIIDAVEIQAAYENARVGNANDLVRQVGFAL